MLGICLGVAGLILAYIVVRKVGAMKSVEQKLLDDVKSEETKVVSEIEKKV